MSQLPPTFPAGHPTTYPATVYDQWVFELSTSGFGAVEAGAAASTVSPISAHVTLRKCRNRDDGVIELSPLVSDTVVVPIVDLLGAASQYPAILSAVSGIVRAVVEYVSSQNQNQV